jgi:hypothetical protein
LDHVPIEHLIAQLEDGPILEEKPAVAKHDPPPPATEDRLPLYDRNGLFVRDITDHEAQGMVNRGSAIGLMANGWDSTMRNDLPWLSVRMVVTRGVLKSSPCCLDHSDMKRIAGEEGDTPAAWASRLKFQLWRKIQ